MNLVQRKQSGWVIHTAAAAAGAVGGGLAQVPLSDSALIIPIQIGMVIRLGKVFNIELTESAALGLTMAYIATFFGRATSQIAIGWFPILGNAVNAGTAASITEGIGWAVAHKLAVQSQLIVKTGVSERT